MPDEPSRSGEAQPSVAAESDLFAAYSSSAAICIVDSDGRFVWMNHEFAAMSAVPASEHFGQDTRPGSRIHCTRARTFTSIELGPRASRF